MTADFLAYGWGLLSIIGTIMSIMVLRHRRGVWQSLLSDPKYLKNVTPERVHMGNLLIRVLEVRVAMVLAEVILAAFVIASTLDPGILGIVSWVFLAFVFTNAIAWIWVAYSDLRPLKPK